MTLIMFGLPAYSQRAKSTEESPLPISTKNLLTGVKSPESKGVIKSVLMIQCPKENRKGTGFVISGGGVVTTNSHVVGSCRAEELVGISAVTDKPVKFSAMVGDTERDLALLCPTEPLPSFLTLSDGQKADVETEVETWGYPLRYQSPAPILSRGYVAGYWTEQRTREDGTLGKPVEHLIVNGALNPGNSGGPLIDRTTGKVIGIVVEKWKLFSPNVEAIVAGLAHPGATLGGGVPIYVTYSNGEVRQVGQTEAFRVAISEIYDMSQVMVGEAISVSELKAFMKDSRKNLACKAQ